MAFFPRLTSLHVDLCSEISPTAFKKLTALRGLRELNVQETEFNETCVASFGWSLSGPHVRLGLWALTCLTGLVTVGISRCRVMPNGYRALRHFSNLTALDLDDMLYSVTDDVLFNLSTLTSLRVLRLQNASVTLLVSYSALLYQISCKQPTCSQGLQALSNLRMLQHLDLQHCRGFRPSDLPRVCALLPRLRYLSFGRVTCLGSREELESWMADPEALERKRELEGGEEGLRRSKRNRQHDEAFMAQGM